MVRGSRTHSRVSRRQSKATQPVSVARQSSRHGQRAPSMMFDRRERRRRLLSRSRTGGNPDPISRGENGSSSFAPVWGRHVTNDEGRRAHSCSSATFFSSGAEGTRTPDPHTARTDGADTFPQVRGLEAARAALECRPSLPLNAVRRTCPQMDSPELLQCLRGEADHAGAGNQCADDGSP